MDSGVLYSLLVEQERLKNRVLAAIEDQDWTKVINSAHQLLDIEAILDEDKTKNS